MAEKKVSESESERVTRMTGPITQKGGGSLNDNFQLSKSSPRTTGIHFNFRTRTRYLLQPVLQRMISVQLYYLQRIIFTQQDASSTCSSSSSGGRRGLRLRCRARLRITAAGLIAASATVVVATSPRFVGNARGRRIGAARSWSDANEAKGRQNVHPVSFAPGKTGLQILHATWLVCVRLQVHP